jgi:hypothetical protein
MWFLFNQAILLWTRRVQCMLNLTAGTITLAAINAQRQAILRGDILPN